MAAGALCVALFSLVHTSVGCGAIPVVGPAIKEMFKGTPDSYYPRRGTGADGSPASDESTYRLLYLCMYGIFGTIAQLAGWFLSASFVSQKKQKQKSDAPTVVMGKRGALMANVYGSFHFMIGLHHMLYSFYGSRYGKLQLHLVGLGNLFGYLAVAFAAMQCMYLGHLLYSATPKTRASRVLRRKTVLDTVSVASAAQMFVFIPAIIKGTALPPHVKQYTWIASIFVLPCIPLVDTYLVRG